MGDLPASLQRARAAAFRSPAVTLAEQAPGPAPLAARDRWQDVQVRPTPRVRQGDYARERQYRVEGARDQFMHGRTLGDRVGAAGTLAANALPAVAAFPPARQAFRAAQAGDWQSAATEGGQAALQIAGAGVPARGGALLGRMSRAAPAARAGEAAAGRNPWHDHLRAQGVNTDEPYFHGTASDFSTFDQRPVSITREVDTANGYASTRPGANVRPVFRRGRDIDWQNDSEEARALMVRAIQSDGRDREAVAALNRLGVSGYHAKGMPGQERVIFDGENNLFPQHGTPPTEAPRPIPLAIRPQMRASDGPQALRVYHGSPNGVEGDFRPYTHFTTDPSYASRMASAGQSARGAVYPVDLELRNPYVIDRDFGPGALITSHDVEARNIAAFQRLEAAGYDGVIDRINNQVVPFPQRIPRHVNPQTRASDGSILPRAEPRPFSNTAGTSADLREAARSGGPMRLYRGSTSGDPQIRPNSYWSKDPAYASRQAMGQGVSEGQSVIPADATFRNPYHVRDARESGMVEVPETGGGAAWIESLRARGHDAIIDDIGNQVYVLDANSVQPAIRQQAAAPRPQHDPMPAAIPSGARDMGNLGKPWRPRNQNDSPVRYYFGEDEAMSYSDGDTWKEISRRINARDWEMQDVRLEDLTAGGQDIIEPGFRRVPWPDGYGNGPPVIIRHRGRMYIEDGNHRLTALAERGVPSARMAVIDMDAAPTPRPQHDPMQGGTPEARERLRAQGFDVDTPLYHGTAGEWSGSDFRGPTYLSPRAEAASIYASGVREGGRVLPAFTRGKFKPVSYDEIQTAGRDQAAVERYRREGYDGLIENDGDPRAPERLVFDPRNIRSRFARGLDSDSSDLLASVGAPLAGAALLNRKRRK